MDANTAQKSIEAFYEAALRPESWPTALAAVADACRSRCVLGQVVGANGYRVIANPDFAALLDDYVAGGWHLRNPRMERGLALTRQGETGLITEHMMMTRDELAVNPYEQAFAPRYGVEHEAGRLTAAHAGSQFVLTVQRSRRDGPYEGAELAAMNRLFDALAAASAFVLRMKFAQAKAIVETFAARGEALALLSPSGICLHHTPAFEEMLGEQLLLRAKRVRAVVPKHDSDLQSLIARAGAWSAPEACRLPQVVIARPAGRPLIVSCHPIAGAARDFLGLASTILLVDDLAGRVESPLEEIVAIALGLTRAEARLTVRLGRGQALREAASEEGITYETARSRLKSIFAKTGTVRQGELASLVGRLPHSPK